MYLVGSFFDFPLKISTFFGDADAIFTVVDLLSLFTAVLIYNMLFYYLTRMIVSPPLCADIVAQGYRSVVGQRETRIYLKLAGSVKRAATSVVHTL
ncbi:putative diguanylate cyclase [Escherichia coli]|uniref:Putative diguanylate cyclase n=1 Tax=Escherichia coli TaxID=562 RepID=A0A377C7Y7_ECOLX|nr:putative diguanylate cyclase [Escherichia coli]